MTIRLTEPMLVEREDADAVRQWAEVAYVPSDGVATKDRPAPPRYLNRQARP